MQIPNLRELRELHGWTQKELADVSGVSLRSVAGYERGAHARPNTARKLAEALNVEVSDLVGATSYPKEPAPPSSLQPPLNGFEEERRSSILAGALTAAAEQWRTMVSSPTANVRQISGVVDAALDLGMALAEQLGSPKAEYSAEEWEGILLVSRLLEISKVGNERARNEVQDEVQEELYRARREQMRELTRRISA